MGGEKARRNFFAVLTENRNAASFYLLRGARGEHRTIETATRKGRSNSEPAVSFDPVTRSAWAGKRAWSNGRGSFSSRSLQSIPGSPASSTTPTTSPPSTLSTPSWNAFDRLPAPYRFPSDTTPFVHRAEKHDFFLDCFTNCSVFATGRGTPRYRYVHRCIETPVIAVIPILIGNDANDRRYRAQGRTYRIPNRCEGWNIDRTKNKWFLPFAADSLGSSGEGRTIPS